MKIAAGIFSPFMSVGFYLRRITRSLGAEVFGGGIAFMNELKNGHKSHGDPNGGPINQGHPPYWRRAHRDWRIWFCVIVMLVAMAIYLMTGDLRWPFHGHPQPMVPMAG
jgi:hypothetical protein